MKKLSGNTIVNMIAAVLLLVTLILVEVSFQTAQGWFDTNYNPLLIALAVLGIVLLVLIAGLNITGTGGRQQSGLQCEDACFSRGVCLRGNDLWTDDGGDRNRICLHVFLKFQSGNGKRIFYAYRVYRGSHRHGTLCCDSTCGSNC